MFYIALVLSPFYIHQYVSYNITSQLSCLASPLSHISSLLGCVASPLYFSPCVHTYVCTVVSLILVFDILGSLMIFPFLPFMIQDFFPSLHRSELGSRAGYLGSSYYIGSFFGSLMVSSSAGTHILLHYVWPTYISMCKHLCMYVYICVCMHMCVQCVCVQYVFPHFLLFVWNFSFPKLWAQVCRLHIAGCTGVIVGYFWDISGRSPMQGLNNDQWLICHCFLCLKFFANKCMTFV
jgi:hypothetical protein